MTLSKTIAVIAVVGLVGCGNAVAPITTVDGAIEALTAADVIAAKYAALPQCPATGGTDGLTCSDAAKVAKIKADAQLAHDAIKTVETVVQSGGVLNLTAFNAVFTELQSFLPASK